MKWITTYEPANMPHRFPDRQAEESDYLCFGLMSTHLWKYSSEKKHLLHSTGTKTECVSDTELLRLYCNKHWKIKPFFVLRDDHEGKKAPPRCLFARCANKRSVLKSQRPSSCGKRGGTTDNIL